MAEELDSVGSGHKWLEKKNSVDSEFLFDIVFITLVTPEDGIFPYW